jgi:hypothetical protein
MQHQRTAKQAFPDPLFWRNCQQSYKIKAYKYTKSIWSLVGNHFNGPAQKKARPFIFHCKERGRASGLNHKNTSS